MQLFRKCYLQPDQLGIIPENGELYCYTVISLYIAMLFSIFKVMKSVIKVAILQ